MPITLVTTAGAANANSYASVNEAETYMSEHFIAQALVAKWNNLSTDQKSAVLIRAAQLLDQYISWRGDIATDEQALSWPRANALDRYGRVIDAASIPLFIKQFQIETAVWVMDQSGIVPEATVGEYDSIKVGPIEVNFNEAGATKRQWLPDNVIAALSPMGSYSAAALGGIHTLKLLRA